MMWAAVIGSPIEHSLSPVIHRAAWDALGIEGWDYRRIDCDEASLPSFIAGLDGSCRGLSVTMPCKQRIMPLLDAIDPLAAAVGAVNTVVPASGVLAGFNTDVTGISSAIRRACDQAGSPLPARALVLGARATASSAVAALGEISITTTTVAARRFGGAGSVIGAASRLGVTIEQVLWSDTDAVRAAASDADVIISTLSAGIADPLATELDVREGQILLDVVYAPRETALRTAFERRGGIIAEGTDMLIYQAGAQVQLMTGRTPDTEIMREALDEALDVRARSYGAGETS